MRVPPTLDERQRRTFARVSLAHAIQGDGVPRSRGSWVALARRGPAPRRAARNLRPRVFAVNTAARAVLQTGSRPAWRVRRGGAAARARAQPACRGCRSA